MTFTEVTSVWGVSAVAILDCSLNVYVCGRQKVRLTMPACCVAANCHNSQATQTQKADRYPIYEYMTYAHNYARVSTESTRCE